MTKFTKYTMYSKAFSRNFSVQSIFHIFRLTELPQVTLYNVKRKLQICISTVLQKLTITNCCVA